MTSIVLVWVLVYTTAVHGGSVTNMVGDFATERDCARVRDAVYAQSRITPTAQCIQVQKVKP
jgi:hypothetical protein